MIYVDLKKLLKKSADVINRILQKGNVVDRCSSVTPGHYLYASFTLRYLVSLFFIKLYK